MQELPKIVAIVGPTASGKTGLGSFLCQKIGGEIISTDAKQVFRGMDIGTAKEKDLPVKQHLIDMLDPGEKVTVAWFQEQAYEAIDGLLNKKIVPVLVGGSGLYVESITEGYVFSNKKSQKQQKRYESLKIGIQIDREILRERVTKRIEMWLKTGLLKEIEGLLKEGVDPEWLDQCGMEYRYFSQYLLGKISQEEAIEKTNISINQFIKRQYTWWRRHDDISWLEDKDESLALVTNFLA